MTVLHYTPTCPLYPSRAFALACMGMKADCTDRELLSRLTIAEEQVGCLAEMRVCYAVLPLTIEGDSSAAGELRLASRSLARALAGCGKCVLMAATLGSGIDRAASAMAVRSPLDALALESAANALIEALCDAFCDDLARDMGEITPRFSPGYGDLSLSTQNHLLSLLDAPRQIGLTLTEGGMMVPTKSVSAIIGIR